MRMRWGSGLPWSASFIGQPSVGRSQRPQQLGEPVGSGDDEIGAGDQLRRRLCRVDRDLHAELEPLDRLEGVEVGRVVAGEQRTREARASQQLLYGRSL